MWLLDVNQFSDVKRKQICKYKTHTCLHIYLRILCSEREGGAYLCVCVNGSEWGSQRELIHLKTRTDFSHVTRKGVVVRISQHVDVLYDAKDRSFFNYDSKQKLSFMFETRHPDKINRTVNLAEYFLQGFLNGLCLLHNHRVNTSLVNC